MYSMSKLFSITLFLSCVSYSVAATTSDIYKVDSQLVQQMARLCAFADGKDYPDDLKLKGMAWCEIGNEFITEQYPKEQKLVEELYKAEHLQNLKQHKKYQTNLRAEKRKFVMETLVALESIN